MGSDTGKRRKPKTVCHLFSGELNLSPTGEVQDTVQSTPERSRQEGRELEYAPRQSWVDVIRFLAGRVSQFMSSVIV